MSAPDPNRCGFEHRPANWCFPAGETWITGWIDADSNVGLADVRAWIDGQIFLGLFDLPFEPGQSVVPNRHRFTFLVEAGRESRRLRLDAWSARRGWTEFFQTAIRGPAIAANGRLAREWCKQLPRFARGLAKCSGRAVAAAADAAVRSALAKPLNILPVPPFFGALETPTDDGYVRGGKLLVSGWLAHRSRSVGQMSAHISGGPEATLYYGLPRRDAAGQFPELTGGRPAHFVGLVERPPVAAEPALLLVFAEMDDGTKQLVFTRRFLPWEAEQAGATGPGQTDWRQLQSGWALLRSACRHGVPWWNLKSLFTIARASSAVSQVAHAAAKEAFAGSTPLSICAELVEDHVIRVPPPYPSPRQCPGGLNVLYVLHGDFSSASALHVLALANELSQRGHACIAAVPGDLDTLADHEDPQCRGVLHAEAMNGVTFPNGRGPDIVHAWTPREGVRVVAERLKQIHTGAKLLVHLEDNEPQILAVALRRPVDELNQLPELMLDRLVSTDLTHPHKGARFLRQADGITMVIDSLATFAPPGIPVQLITPAADRRHFYPRPRLDELRRFVDPTGEATVLFYNGNVHPANAAEMREFYAAILRLNHDGLPARLIRTGCDRVDFLGPVAREVAPFVVELGRIQWHRHLAPLMALADMFVQPGSGNEFNSCRLPSKLPEFFSIGRPVILPRTNLGLITRHRIDAYVLEQADCAHIVEAVKELRADRSLYETLSRGATEFARQQFSWERSAGELAAFYASIMTAKAGTGR